MSTNTGKAPRPDRAGRKVACGLAGVGSAAAIVGAGVAGWALPGHAAATGQATGAQQATLTATLSPTLTGGGPASTSAPLVGPGAPGVKTFGVSGQVSLDLVQAFPSLFGEGGQQAAFDPNGLSSILNVSLPRDSGLAGFLPFNNVPNTLWSLLSPTVNPGQTGLPSSTVATNFIDPQPQFVSPDLVNLQNSLANIVSNYGPAAQAAVTEAANQVSANLQTIDGLFPNLQAGSSQPMNMASPIPFIDGFQNPSGSGNPALPGQVPDWVNEFKDLLSTQEGGGSSDNGGAALVASGDAQGTPSPTSGSITGIPGAIDVAGLGDSAVAAAATQSPQLADSFNVSPSSVTDNSTGAATSTPTASTPTASSTAAAGTGTPTASQDSQPPAAPAAPADTTPPAGVADTSAASSPAYAYDSSAAFSD